MAASGTEPWSKKRIRPRGKVSTFYYRPHSQAEVCIHSCDKQPLSTLSLAHGLRGNLPSTVLTANRAERMAQQTAREAHFWEARVPQVVIQVQAFRGYG